MTRSVASIIQREMRALGTPERAAGSMRFFRTGPGEYGEGDRFIGLTVPEVRTFAKRHRDLARDDVLALLHSPWHEERLLALLIMVDAHARGEATTRAELTREYLANSAYVNNWDLVDASAAQLLGSMIDPRELSVLDRLVVSWSLWERRIAMVATHHHIKRDELRPALYVAERLLGDRHDLIHKAVGWMLREVGKRDTRTLLDFLAAHHARLPRTSLRYAIERFTPDERRALLAGEGLPDSRR